MECGDLVYVVRIFVLLFCKISKVILLNEKYLVALKILQFFFNIKNEKYESPTYT